MTTRRLFDTSVYIAILRDATFAETFRPRYVRDIPLTHCSSVVIHELLAGARTPRHRRQAALLYEPFERARRIVTPTHLVWKEAAAVVATDAAAEPTGYGLGRHGWVSLSVEPDAGEERWTQIAEWVRTSYTLVAPKKLARLVLIEDGLA